MRPSTYLCDRVIGFPVRAPLHAGTADNRGLSKAEGQLFRVKPYAWQATCTLFPTEIMEEESGDG